MRLQACIARLKWAFRVANDAAHTGAFGREHNPGGLRQPSGYFRSNVEESDYLHARVRELTERLLEMAVLLAHAREGPAVRYPPGPNRWEMSPIASF